jgi:hypothetical protein
MRSFPIAAAAGALLLGTLTGACSRSPAAPSPAASSPAAAEPMVAAEAAVTTQAAGLSAEDLAARGWDCRPAPIPNRVGCSAPNQQHPASIPGPPPPDDRPAAINLFVFDSGVFIGTNLLIRSDLYHDQPCRSTGGLYRFIERIGYYECLHVVNAP